MAAKIFHWIDAKKQSHYTDYLPSGQIEVEDKYMSNGVAIINAGQTKKIQSLARGNPIAIPQSRKTNNVNFSNHNVPNFSLTGLVIFIVALICIIHWFKNNKKENYRFKSERYKINDNSLVLKAESALPSYREDDKTEKGLSGELMVSRILSRNLDKAGFKLINGVTLKSDTGTTQIDHVLISNYGLFVIETKNMSGWIYGSANQKIWTQTLSRSKEKFQFQNPIHQNYKHTKALQALLNINSSKFFSLVVFAGDSQFRSDMPENVVNKDSVIDFIKNKNSILLNQDEVIEIYNKIKLMRLKPTINNHSNHIEYVETIAERRQKVI